MSDDTDLRDLCNRFLDSIERRDMGAVAEILSPDLQFWANFTNQTKSRDAMLEAIGAGYAAHRRRTYDDRQIRTFDHGFLAQYTCRLVRHDGSSLALWAAMVAEVRDGRIVRVDEYLDSGKFAKQPASGAAR